MNTSKLSQIRALIKEIEENLNNIGNSIKAFNIIAKNTLKLLQPFDSHFNTLSKLFTTSKLFNTERYQEMTNHTSQIISDIMSQHTLSQNRWTQLVNALNQLEVYYSNQLAIFKAKNTHFEKIIKKPMKELKNLTRKNSSASEPVAINESLSSNVKEFLRDIINIEHSIYHNLFLCFKNYKLSEINSYKNAMEEHQKTFHSLCLLIDYTTITDFHFSSIIEHPELFYHQNQPASAYTVNKLMKFSATKPPKRYSGFDKLKKLNIAFTQYKAKDSGCIDMNPGDVMVYLEEVNGWFYGTNTTSQEIGWFPASFTKSPETLHSLFTSASTKISP